MPTATAAPPLAFFWGEDAWSIERAARDYRAALEADAGQPFDVWRAPSDDEEGDPAANEGGTKRKTRALDEIGQHLATATLFGGGTLVIVRDRKSTRLNSSHGYISYAVFCLKKKKKNKK